MTATASHIHEGAPGTNGPVIVPFTKTGDNTFASAEGAKLTESQYASYKAGNLYVNVHSAAHPVGEIRAPDQGRLSGPFGSDGTIRDAPRPARLFLAVRRGGRDARALPVGCASRARRCVELAADTPKTPHGVGTLVAQRERASR